MELKPTRKIGSEASIEQPRDNFANQTTKTSETAPNSNTKESSENILIAGIKKFFDNSNVWWFLLAAGLAVGLKFLAKLFIVGTSVGFVWGEIITLCFALLIAGAYGSMSKKGKMAGAIVIFLILITASSLVRHDYSVEKAERHMKKQAKNIVVDRNKIDFLLYGTGKTYAYELQAGEFTPWRGFKDNYFSNAGISSETYDYTIYFSDGTSYKGGPDTPIPVKKGNVFVRVKANSAQTVYISVL